MSTPALSAPLRLVIADDQALVRSGFAMMLGIEDDIDVVGQATNGREAVDLVRELTPDIVLMDVQMPVLDGIEATREIVAQGCTKVVILTTFDRDDYLFDGLRAGASGFLLKNAEPEVLVDAVRAVASGQSLLAPEVTGRVIAAMTAEKRADPDPARTQDLARLTEREREVLVLIGRGKSNAEIAKELFLGEATVKTHASSCFAKLHLRDRVQAVVFAYESGLVHPGQ